MLFQTKMIIQTRVSQREQTAYLGKLISSIDRAPDHRSRIWDDPIQLVILSAYDSIYLNMKNYETNHKTHIDIEYEREKCKNGGNLDFNYFVNQVSWPMRIGLVT